MSEPLPHPIFLIIDHNAEGRMLIGRTLRRKYPNAILQECDTLEAALTALRESRIDAVVSHRAIGYDGVTTLQMIRYAQPAMPIVMVSGVDRAKEAHAAGAEFIRFDAWLTVGSVVERLLQERASSKDTPQT
jgi:DNA-binding NtrC family response regulator